MAAIGTFDEVEIFRFRRSQSRFDRFEADGTDRIGWKPLVAVGVEGTFILFYPFVSHFGVGVSPIVEGAIHLQWDPFFESIVDHGSYEGHLLCIGRLFLDDGSDGHHLFEPKLRIVSAVDLLGESFMFL